MIGRKQLEELESIKRTLDQQRLRAHAPEDHSNSLGNAGHQPLSQEAVLSPMKGRSYDNS